MTHKSAAEAKRLAAAKSSVVKREVHRGTISSYYAVSVNRNHLTAENGIVRPLWCCRRIV